MLDLLAKGMVEYSWIILGVSIFGFFLMLFLLRFDLPDWFEEIYKLLVVLFWVGILGGGYLSWASYTKESERASKRLGYEIKKAERKEAEEKAKKLFADMVLPDLIPCVTCKKKISKRAETCLGCGEKVSHSWDYYYTVEGLVELRLSPEEMKLYKKLKGN